MTVQLSLTNTYWVDISSYHIKLYNPLAIHETYHFISSQQSYCHPKNHHIIEITRQPRQIANNEEGISKELKTL